MHLVYAPHLKRNVVIGAVKTPDPHAPRLKLARYLDKVTIPTSPGSAAYNGAAMSVIQNLEGNDAYGDCVEAEEAHFIAVVTGTAGKLFSYTAAMTEAMYSTLTGFNPAIPSSDQGTDPTACLNYFTQNPYADGSVNLGYLMVDATNQAEIQYALYQFGNLKIWLSLPTPYVSPFPSGNGFVWDVAAPNPANGHCIGSCGYYASGAMPAPVEVLGVTAQGILIMTWGLIGTLTWAAAAALCVPAASGGMAVRVTRDWLNANGASPTGLNLSQLLQDIDAIGGSIAVPTPVPTPPAPTPPPTPTSPPTLVAAQTAIATAFTTGTQYGLYTQAQSVGIANAALKPLWP